jgi:HD-like signal output (HDOD) protein/ActR/RegA family two-component response regulator
MRRRILFVDGPACELRDLRLELAARRAPWTIDYASGGQAALDSLAQHPCDAVVADLFLEDMPGLEFLTRVLSQYPQTHRLVLTDLGDPASLFRCVGGVHQFLSKPCEIERLEIVLDRTFAFQLWLPNQTVRALMGRLPNLPSIQEDYTAIIKELRQESPSVERVAARVLLDPPAAAKLLQLANSAAYGPPLDESDPVRAVRDLGLTNTQGALLLAHTFSDFHEASAAGFSASTLHQHACRTSQLARRIAETEHADHQRTQQAATAGLLHDLGKLALAVNLPEPYREARKSHADLPDWEAEQKVFGANHAEIAGCLLALWNLPVPVVEAVALHHHPTRFGKARFSPLTAVHVANVFDHAPDLRTAARLVDSAYLQELGLEDRLTTWWNACTVERESHRSSEPITMNSSDG